MATKEKILEAVENFGLSTVQEVRLMVNMADPDGAYTQFEDEGMFEHAECVAFLYFEEE
jgi:hypothetical protein